MLVENIQNDMRSAMKARDALRLSVLRGALSAFTNELVAKNKKPTDTLDDADAVAVLKRLAKQRKDSAEQFEKGDRAEMAQKERDELVIIEEYLPQMASREDVEKAADAKIAEIGADKGQMGVIIGAVMKDLGGNADGAVVKEVVAAKLQ